MGTAETPRSDTTYPVTHDARDLVREGATARILLDGEAYTLRITRSGKLILTK